MRTHTSGFITRTGAAALVLLLALAPAARAQQAAIGCYTETIVVRASGAAEVRVVVDVPAGAADPLVLPLASREIASLATESALPASAVVSMRGDRPVLVVAHTASPAVQSLAITYVRPSFLDMTAPPLAFGNRSVTYDFVNTTAGAVAEFHASIVLPPDFGVTALDRVLPPVSESTVTLPYEVGETGGLVNITLSGRDIPIGGTEALTVRIKPRSSPLPLAAGALLASAWYLVRFRDRIRREPSQRRDDHGS